MKRLRILRKAQKSSNPINIGITSNQPEVGQFIQIWRGEDDEIWSNTFRWFDDTLGCFCPKKDDWVEAIGNYGIYRGDSFFVIVPDEEEE